MEKISNFLEDNCNSLKKVTTFVHKECNMIVGCFTKDNNLGNISDVPIGSLAKANIEFNKISYTNPVYIFKNEEGVYISYEDSYAPIVTRRLAKQETNEFIIYRYLVVDDKGKLLKSILVNKTLKAWIL